MKEETDSIYGKPKFGLIVGMFAVALLLILLLGWLFLRTGHPAMHTQPQPRNNKGMLQPDTQAAPRIEAALTLPVMVATSRS